MNNLNKFLELIENTTKSMDAASQINSTKTAVDQKISDSIQDISYQKSKSPLSNKITNLTEQYGQNLDQILLDIRNNNWSDEEDEGLKQKLTTLYKSFVNYKRGINSILESNDKSVQLIEDRLILIGQEFICKNCKPELINFLKSINISLNDVFSIVDINKEDRLIEIAILCIQRGVIEQVIQNIDKFGIKDQKALFEIAMLCIQNGLTEQVIQNIDKFGIKDQKAIVEIAKICIQSGVAGRVISNINKFGITDQKVLFEIAKLCIKNGGVYQIIPNIDKFGFTDQEILFQFATFCIQNDLALQVAYSIDKFGITDQKILLQIALFLIQNGSAVSVANNINKFIFEDQDEALLDLVKLCITSGGAKEIIWNLGNLRITDQKNLLMLAELSAKNGAAVEVVQNFQRFGIEDKNKIFDIYRLGLQFDKSDAGVEAIHQSNFFSFEFGLFAKEPIIDGFYESFDFEKSKEKVIDFQRKYFDGFPYNDVLDEVMEIKDLAIRYKNMLLLADMIMLLPYPSSQLEWVNKNILPSIFKFTKPRLRLYLVRCVSILLGDQKGVENFNHLLNEPFKIENDKYWKKLTCLLSAVLINQGVSPEIFTEKDSFRYETEKKGSIFDKKENTKSLVEILLLLAQNETISGDEKGAILKRIIIESSEKNQKQILNNIYSVIALINFSANLELKDTSKELVKISEEAFRKKCPISTVKDFPAKYAQKITESRNPSAIITYAGKIDSLNDKNASACLGNYLTGLLNGTFQEDRYKLENNFHLQTIEKFQPGMLAKWKKSVCESEKLEDLILEKQTIIVEKQSAKDWMTMKLITDQHLVLDGLDFLKNYLVGEDHGAELDEAVLNQLKTNQNKSESKILKLALDIQKTKLRIQGGGERQKEFESKQGTKLKKLKKEILGSNRPDLIDKTPDELVIELKTSMQSSEEKLCKLQLQQLCIRFVKGSEELKKMEENKDPGIKGKKGQLIFSLEGIEKHLESAPFNQPEFLNDIKGKRAEMKGIKTLKEGAVIIDTDDPIDLLLCGTEVSGSCQRVDGDAKINKGLLGYLMDGKNRLIAIKSSAGESEKIQARCLIRVLSDGKMPVLFMERVYSDVTDSRYNQALTIIAKRKAASLGIPLVSLDGKGAFYSKTLSSLGGPSPWEYSDGSGDAEAHASGIYKISKAKYVL